MNTEFGFNTYILLGNALNYVLNGRRLDFQAEFNVPEDAVGRLYRAIEPVRPDKILAAVAALPDSDKTLLGRCCRYCLRALEDDELTALVGLPRDVIEAVLKELSLENTHA